MRGRLVRLGMSDRSFKTTAAPSSPRSAGECQMAVTAIDHDGRIVTVTSQRVEVLSASGPSHDYAFTTKIHGGSLKDTMWHGHVMGGLAAKPRNGSEQSCQRDCIVSRFGRVSRLGFLIGSSVGSIHFCPAAGCSAAALHRRRVPCATFQFSVLDDRVLAAMQVPPTQGEPRGQSEKEKTGP
jgi:hypothetical protein